MASTQLRQELGNNKALEILEYQRIAMFRPEDVTNKDLGNLTSGGSSSRSRSTSGSSVVVVVIVRSQKS